jgi:decaprenyl-phosphate phosphoribosyltransferase
MTKAVKARADSPFPVLAAITKAIRPGQWVKNSLVLAGALFSGLASERGELWIAALGGLAFTLASSAVYLGNDIRDRASDRAHPTKRDRPIASGALSVPLATTLAAIFLALAFLVAARIGMLFVDVLGFYVLTNIVYSLGAKRIVIVDIILVSLGFVLRAVAGAAAVGVPASSWIIVCTLELAMLVVVGKRRVDLATAEASGTRHQLPDEWYTVPFLDLLMAVAAGASIVTYALYTLDPETVARLGNRRLVLTVPMVVYGCLRYAFLIQTGRGDADPTAVLISDWGLRTCAFAWIVMAVIAVYS